MNIPVEAVEVAAKAHWENGNSYSWVDEDGGVRADGLDDMRAALEAAAPHMLAEAFAYGWREGKGIPTPIDMASRELLHGQAARPAWNPYSE